MGNNHCVWQQWPTLGGFDHGRRNLLWECDFLKIFFFLWGTAPKCWNAALEAVVVTGGKKIRNLSTFLHSHMALGHKTIVGCLVLGEFCAQASPWCVGRSPKVTPEEFVQPNFPLRGWEWNPWNPFLHTLGWFGILWEKWQSKVWSYKKKREKKTRDAALGAAASSPDWA